MKDRTREILYWILEQEGDNLWRLGRALHEALDVPLGCVKDHPRLAFWHPFAWFWQIWWRIGYRWVYPFMYKAKADGKKFAQTFGEGYPAFEGKVRDGETTPVLSWLP
jgi:hypothetical protein